MERRFPEDYNNDFCKEEQIPSGGRVDFIPLITAVCLSAMMCCGVYISSAYPTYDGDTHRILWIFLLILVVLALISIIVIFILSKIRRSFWILCSGRNQYADLKCVFMWLLGAVVLVDILLSFTANIQCMLKHLDNLDLYVYYALVHVLYVIYFIMQNIFVHVFKNTTFYNRTFINFSILFVALANSVLGFSAYIGHYYMYNRNNQTVLENSSNAAKESFCYINSEMGNLHEQLRPYLVPCRIEYCMIVAHFVFSMWPSITGQSSKRQAALATNKSRWAIQHTTLSIENEEESLPYQLPNDIDMVSSSQLSIIIRKLFIGYGIISNIILVVGSWIQVQYTYVFYSYFSNYLFLFYKIYTLMILILSFHIWSTRRYKCLRTKEMTMSEYFLVCTGACGTAVCTFYIMVSLKLMNGIDIGFILASVSTIIDIIYQIILILILKRSNCSQIDKIMNILLLSLAIANFIHWISDTFVVVSHFNRERYIEEVYGEEMANFDHYAIFPLLMYFRLISSLELLDFYRKRSK